MIIYPENYKIAALIREIDKQYLSIYQGYCTTCAGQAGEYRGGREISNEGY